jgi:secreted trypsin-like serine protease
MIPATTIKMKHTTNITLTNIFTNADTNIGNAVVSLIAEPDACADDSIQLPIKGTLVFNLMPQQTQGVSHG